MTGHAALNVTDATPRIQPGAKGVHGAIVGGQRESGEAEGCPEELAALVEHASVHQIFHHGFALFRLRTKSFWCSYHGSVNRTASATNSEISSGGPVRLRAITKAPTDFLACTKGNEDRKRTR